MRPETRRRLINGIISLVVIAGLLRFFSGELSRKDEIHEREVKRLTSQLFVSQTTVQSLKTKIKDMEEDTRIIRTKDKDGNEKEVIEKKTKTHEASTEQQQIISKLEHKIETLEAEKEYIRKSSTPIGQVGTGYDPFNNSVYFRANYSILGPFSVDFITTNNMVGTDAHYYVGLGWTF